MSLIATSSVALFSINTFHTSDCLSLRDIPSVSTNVLNGVPLKRGRVEGARKRCEKVRKEGKKEKWRRTCRSADIAKAGEDTSGGSAQRWELKGGKGGKEEYTDAPGAVTSLLH